MRPAALPFLACLVLAGSLALAGCGDGGQNATAPEEEPDPEQAAAAGDEHHPAVEARSMEAITEDLHSQLLTIDTHVDIPDTFATDAVDPASSDRLQVDLEKMTAGNLNTVFFIVYVSQKAQNEVGYSDAVKMALNKFDAIHRMAEDLYPERIALAKSAADILRIREEGKLVALIGVENGFAFGSDLSTVDDYYQRGMRYAGFAHMGHSNFADSSMPRSDLDQNLEQHGGLSDLGRQLLAKLNGLGVMVDVSHTSRAATLEIARLSTAPVLASHSGVKGVYDHCRNLTDEELLAIKATGGVVQIVAYDSYLARWSAEKAEAIKGIREKYGVSRPGCDFSSPISNAGSPELAAAYYREFLDLNETWPRADVGVLVDHIDYAVKLIGIDHVGISSDFGGGGGLSGWMNASETPNVTAELISRGYSVGDIKKIWGENLLRVMREVEAKAQKAD